MATRRQEDALVNFDVLLRSKGAGRVPQIANIEQFKPPPDAIEDCRRWFASQGITCHTTQFGLACSAPAGQFSSLFKVKLSRATAKAGAPTHKIQGTIGVPSEIADLVEQITISGPPEFF